MGQEKVTLAKKYKKTSFESISIPVVVFGSGLGITRSLGRLGVSVYGIDKNAWTPSLHSRYCRGGFIWDVENIAPELNVQRLLEVAKKIGERSILVPTSDEGTLLLADHANQLSESFIFPHLLPQLVRALTSKKEMYFTAKKHDIPTPEACFPQSRDDVKECVANFNFPIMLKGISGKALERRSRKRMFIARTKEELFNLYDRNEDPLNPNFMLQEYIPGGENSVWMFNGYFNERSECLFGLTGRKIRQAPAYTGATSLGVCLKNDIVAETTRHFMKSVGYQGMLDIGYRYDERDGKYKVLDVNPRIGSTFRLFVGDNGLDVARVAYLDLTGQQVPSSRMIEGRKWLVEDSDIVSSIRYHNDKNLTFMQWAKSLRGVQETAWFAVDDLFPFFVMCNANLHEFRKRLRYDRTEGFHF